MKRVSDVAILAPLPHKTIIAVGWPQTDIWWQPSWLAHEVRAISDQFLIGIRTPPLP